MSVKICKKELLISLKDIIEKTLNCDGCETELRISDQRGELYLYYCPQCGRCETSLTKYPEISCEKTNIE
jgi:predicted RNA-binding Zn-ribbon protein involved in translation (DUF1610 family)